MKSELRAIGGVIAEYESLLSQLHPRSLKSRIVSASLNELLINSQQSAPWRVYCDVFCVLYYFLEERDAKKQSRLADLLQPEYNKIKENMTQEERLLLETVNEDPFELKDCISWFNPEPPIKIIIKSDFFSSNVRFSYDKFKLGNKKLFIALMDIVKDDTVPENQFTKTVINFIKLVIGFKDDANFHEFFRQKIGLPCLNGVILFYNKREKPEINYTNIVNFLYPKMVSELKKNKFLLDDLLGSGSYGQVFALQNDASSVNEAPPRALKINFDTCDKKEIEIMKYMKNILGTSVPNIVSFDMELTCSINGFIMERANRGSLRDLMVNSPSEINEAFCITFALGIANALEKIHGLSIVHSDISHNNVFLRDDLSPVLGDFGLATLFNTKHNLRKVNYGCIHFLSPTYAKDKLKAKNYAPVVRPFLEAKSNDLHAFGMLCYMVAANQLFFNLYLKDAQMLYEISRNNLPGRDATRNLETLRDLEQSLFHNQSRYPNELKKLNTHAITASS